MSHGTGCALPHKYGVYANVTRFKDWIITTILNEFTEKEIDVDFKRKMKDFEKNWIKWNNVTFYLHLYFTLNSLIKKNKWKRKLYVLLFFWALLTLLFQNVLTHSFASLNWRRSGVFIINFENISHLALVFLLLTLSNKMPAGKKICKELWFQYNTLESFMILNITFYAFKVSQKNSAQKKKIEIN